MLTANRARALALLGLLALALTNPRLVRAQTRRSGTPSIPAAALSQARARGTTRVIVGLDVDFTPEPLLQTAGALAQRTSIARAQDAVLGRMLRVNAASVRRFSYIPFLAAEVDERDLQVLASSPEVTAIEVDELARPTLAESTPLIGATRAWAAGYAGSGWTVAILDTGVDKTHPFLAGKVVSEGCYSSTVAGESTSVCPGGTPSSTAPGSGAPCTVSSCAHGTHVAGIAAGKGSSFSGVARDGSLIAIQVFSSITDTSFCGSTAPCAGSFASDQILALERVYELRATYSIAAANLSLGAGLFTTPCDTNPAKAIIDQLRAAGIATVIASGNNGSTNALSAPACISTAISVASTTDGTSGLADRVSNFSNTNQYLSLFAPGETILSSVPGGGFTNMIGTSMASPHVAGAWAVVKSKQPSASVDDVLNALATTGTPILDPGNGITKPRINVDLALQVISPPCSYAVTPTQVAVSAQLTNAVIAVNTQTNCPWTAASLSSFILAPIPQGAVGSGMVSFTITRNTTRLKRDGFVSVAGTTVTVSQQGAMGQPDLNGDGRADLLWQNLSDGGLATWYLDGWNVLAGQSLGISRVSDTNWRVVGSGDLDGDGYADLVWQHKTQGWVAVWYLAGNQVRDTKFLSINQVADLDWEIKGVADIDGDGKADLIWQHRTQGWLAAWLMNGEQVVATSMLSIGPIPDPNWQIVGAGDVNGDGFADLVWQHQTDGWLAVWYLHGTNVIGTELLSVGRITDAHWHIRAVGDVDADGHADIIWQNDATGALGVWLLNGSSVINQHGLSIPIVPDLNWRIVGPG